MITSALCSQVPVIVFSKGTRDWDTLGNLGADAIGMDQEISMAEAARHLSEDLVLQGNFNPALLSEGTPEDVRAATLDLLTSMAGRDGYIFNLGHGVPPDAQLENLQTLTETVKNFSRSAIH